VGQPVFTIWVWNEQGVGGGHANPLPVSVSELGGH
jgi:hypothetical protein